MRRASTFIPALAAIAVAAAMLTGPVRAAGFHTLAQAQAAG
jgi:hypothetical protein